MSTWTPEREKKLAVLWTQGLSCSQIAKELGGVTRNAVIGKRVRMGLPDREAPHAFRTGNKRPPSNHPIKRRASVAKAPAAKAQPAPPPTHKQIGAPRGDWNKRYGEVMGDAVCKRFVAEECGTDGLVCAKPLARGSWCERCASDVFQPLKLASAA